MKLHSRVCEILQIEQPIVLAGMGGASSPALAAAVSNAGGLGVLGAQPAAQPVTAMDSSNPRNDRQAVWRDTLLPASVRRANYEDSDGPTPRDLLPERRAFAEEFMRKEGLEPPANQPPRQEEDGPPLFTQAFFEAQMEVIIQERIPVYASGLGNPAVDG